MEANLVEAFNIFSKLYSDGLEEAYYQLSNCYLYGLGVEKDYTKALEIAKLGLDKKYNSCNIALGISYLYGLGNKKSYRKARKYFIKAVDTGNYDGCYYIGLMKFNGFGLWKSSKDAFETFFYGFEHHSLLCSEILEERYHKGRNNKFKDKVYKDKKGPILIFNSKQD